MARAPLSDLQYAYLLGELGDEKPGRPALFFEEYACEQLDLISLSSALHDLMRRHEMLRATFDASGMLRVHNELPVPLSYQSLRGQPEEVCRRRLADSRDECYRNATPLIDSAPFAVRVFAMEHRTVVQVCGRLLAIDGFSGEILAHELAALLAGERLSPLRYTFREYRQELERRKELPEYAAARGYWVNRLAAMPPAPQLPLRQTRSDTDAPMVRRIYRMPVDQWRSFAATARKHRLTPTMAIGAAFCEVLRHWAKCPDFTINIMYGEREPLNLDVAGLIGNFCTTVLLECAPGPRASTFLDRAKGLRRQLASDLDHSAFSGVSVIRELNQRNGESREAPMPIVFTSLLGSSTTRSDSFLEHLGWQRLLGGMRTPQQSLNHQVYVADNELVIRWDSADDLFEPGVVDEMFAAYREVLAHLATSADAWRAESFDLTPAKQRETRDWVNDTAGDMPTSTLHGLFAQQANRFPDRLALITPAGQLSYAQLRARAHAVAATLRAHGTRPGDLVGVTAPRGVSLVAALLGVLMAGAAYVPISPHWPIQRREQVSRMCGLRQLLVDDDDSPSGVSQGVDVLALPEILGRESLPSSTLPACDSDSLAYVMFDAENTGTPKGVMVKHAAVVNTLLDVNRRFGIDERDRVLAISDYGTGPSVWEMLGLLAAGGTVVLPEPGLAQEVTHLYDLAMRHETTVWHSHPAYLAMFIEFVRAGGRASLTAWRLAMVSGGQVPMTLGRDVLDAAPNALCARLGGATEASIWSSIGAVPADPPPEWTAVPFGQPLRNQRLYVLDRQMKDRPDWVAGRLYIAGRGLAEGYLGRPDLTAAVFRTHPRTGETIYCTGEWARYLPDGTLQHFSREESGRAITGPSAAAPVGATERALARMWEELLGLPEIGRDDDFFARGGNALLGAQLMNSIELEFGQRLPLAALYAAGTVKLLAQQLASQATSVARGSLVRLGGCKEREPLVLIHPTGGDLWCYRHLVSNVEQRRCVLGLSAMDHTTAVTVEEMAVRYLAEIRAMTEDRPMRLAGWSLGGVIAYEMGRRMLREGRECNVVMIDPWVRRNGGSPVTSKSLVGSFIYHLAESEVDLATLNTIDSQEPPLDALHRLWSSANGDHRVLKSFTFEELSRGYQVFARNTSALLRYNMVPEPDIPVQVIEAVDGLGGPAAKYLAPLSEAMPGFAATMTLPGNHFTLLDSKTIEAVAPLL